MLIACKDCRLALDVSGIAHGELVRCLCGSLNPVPEAKRIELRTLHCSGCGGTLKQDASRCDYCGGEVSLDERMLGDSCPQCFARSAIGARYCRECGAEIDPRRVRATPVSASCPRCRGALELRAAEAASFTECRMCGGLWLDEAAFERAIEERDFAPLGKIQASRKPSAPRPSPRDTRYLPCPACGELMNRKNFARASGVIIDWCKGHGWWFDCHELEKALEFVRRGGLDKTRAAEITRAKQEIARLERQAKVSARAAAGQRCTSPRLYDAVGDFLISALADLVDR